MLLVPVLDFTEPNLVFARRLCLARAKKKLTSRDTKFV